MLKCLQVQCIMFVDASLAGTPYSKSKGPPQLRVSYVSECISVSCVNYVVFMDMLSLQTC
jgi:hypothetical protein